LHLLLSGGFTRKQKIQLFFYLIDVPKQVGARPSWHFTSGTKVVIIKTRNVSVKYVICIHINTPWISNWHIRVSVQQEYPK